MSKINNNFPFSDFKQLIIKNIVKEQKHIVQDCISNDIVANFNETPVSNTIKRKFIKRFNEMTLVNNGYQSEAHCSSTEVEGLKPVPQGCSTPIKDAIFPETSYHTPPNQKHVYKVPDSEVYQTVLYVAPDDHQNNLKQKVSQKENFVEVIVPPSVSSQTGLYEIATKDPKDFIFSPKIENLKTRNPFGCLENSDKNVLSKWKNKLKHVYDCGPKKDNIQLGENTVINLRKNLLFEDCDNVLSRPKKICKRNRSSDVTLKNIQSSPFSKFMNENDSNCSTRSEIRRKLNYSNDLSFDGEHFDAIETSENIRHFPTSLFTEVGEPSKTNFKFIKPKSNFEIGENFNKHKIDNDCKYCTKNNGNAEKTYKSNFAPSSPLFNELGEPVLMPKSPKYEYKNSKQFFTEMGESSKSKTSERVFEASKHYSPIKNRHSRLIESRKSSPKKLEPFKLNIKGLSNPNTTENIDWKPFEDFNKLENIRFKSLVVDPSSPNCHTNSKMAAVRSRSPFTVSSTNYSPGDKRKCCPHCLQSPKRNKLQVVPLSPSEYMLRKKVLPHTITSDMKPKNIPDSPVFRLF